MSPVERRVLRYIVYGTYVVATVGAGVGVGHPWGWFVVVAFAAVPGISLVKWELDERSIARDRKAGYLPPLGEANEGGEASASEAAPPPPPPPPPY